LISTWVIDLTAVEQYDPSIEECLGEAIEDSEQVCIGDEEVAQRIEQWRHTTVEYMTRSSVRWSTEPPVSNSANGVASWFRRGFTALS